MRSRSRDLLRGVVNGIVSGWISIFRILKGLTVAEKLVLISLAHDDQSASASVLVGWLICLACAGGLSLPPLVAPFAFDDVQSWLQCAVNEVVRQTVVLAVVKLDRPQTGVGCKNSRSAIA